MTDMSKTDFIERAKLYIHKRVAIDPETNCWVWQRVLDRDGYGVVNGPVPTGLGLGKLASSHRVAYIVFKGPPGSSVVRHSCNLRSCCNPEHLDLGTHRQNMDDRMIPLSGMTDPALINRKRSLEAQLAKVNAELQGRVSLGFLDKR